jgi:hypothetical protein
MLPLRHAAIFAAYGCCHAAAYAAIFAAAFAIISIRCLFSLFSDAMPLRHYAMMRHMRCCRFHYFRC